MLIFRQKRELDQLVQYEVKRAQIQSKAEAKLEKQEERAQAQVRLREEKEKAWREALREQELKRLAAEKEEEANVKVSERVRTVAGTVLYSNDTCDNPLAAWLNLVGRWCPRGFGKVPSCGVRHAPFAVWACGIPHYRHDPGTVQEGARVPCQGAQP
jgi:hypothetical protein